MQLQISNPSKNSPYSAVNTTEDGLEGLIMQVVIFPWYHHAAPSCLATLERLGANLESPIQADLAWPLRFWAKGV